MRCAPDPRPQPLAPQAVLGPLHRQALLCWVDDYHYPLDPDLRAWLERQLWTRPTLAVARQLDALDAHLASGPAEPANTHSDLWGATLMTLAKMLRIVQQHPEYFGWWSCLPP